MAPNDIDATSSLVVSLWKSFRQVPPDSVPAVLDCLLASTASSPSSLFASLIDSSPDFDKDLNEGSDLDSDHCNYLATFISALCHLLKKLAQFDAGLNHDALKMFIWRIFIPLMKALHTFDRELLNQVVESFTVVVAETSSWVVMEANLVPYLLRSVYNSLGMVQNEESETNIFGCLAVEKEHFQYPTWSLPLSISCHILASMLDVAISNQKSVMISKSAMANGGAHIQHFSGTLIWSVCTMTECMLSQSLEHRSCAIRFILPIIFKVFGPFHSFEVVIHGRTSFFSRNDFFVKIWKCCRALFSQGAIERRDAYSVLSLYMSFLPCTDESSNIDTTVDNDERLDITTDLEFWEEIRKGLIDKESLVRKQSLHMLKIAVRINRESRSSCISEAKSCRKRPTPSGMIKREAWANIEAKSLGVGRICDTIESTVNSDQKWEAFVLLYEMLEEYGTHLVEAAWNHQVSLLLESPSSHASFSIASRGKHQNDFETSSEIFSWLVILWERGLHHDNPQVRCLIMESITGINWKIYGNFAKSVPETFVLGSFLQALNDPVHHKEFGVKGVYSSETIEGAKKFLCSYASCLFMRKGIAFMTKLASSTKQKAFSRVGFMSLCECLASAAHGIQVDDGSITERSEDPSPQDDKIVFLDALRFVIESSKQHFNSNYRLQVCQNILRAGASVVCSFDVPLEVLLNFISTFPREFTDYGGSLRVQVQEWIMGCGKEHCTAKCIELEFLKILYDFPYKVTATLNQSKVLATYDDGDIEAWESEARRWARVLFLAVKEECEFIPTRMFIQSQSHNFSNQYENEEHLPVKFLILTSSLVMELQIMQERNTEYGIKFRTRSESSSTETLDKISYADSATLYQLFTDTFLSFVDELVVFTELSCSVFYSGVSSEVDLPGSVKGKLGGPSQRRLPSSTATAVLQAITSVKTIALISSWCAQFGTGKLLHLAFKCLWKFCWNTISSPVCDSENGAEIQLAAYESLSSALKALALVFSSQTLDYFNDNKKQLLPKERSMPLLDFVALSFLQNINDILGTGVLVRTRRSVLMNWKWLCLESLLSMPGYAVKNGIHLGENKFFFSDAALRQIFDDLVDNLENAGEASVLPILRSVRFSLDLFARGKLNSLVSSCNGVEFQTVWNLVRSSWILHASCNKRKVAPIAALLSSVLHSSIFADERMHKTDDGSGPLKWFVERVLEEGTKSPRTIRLAALHLSGLWLSNPKYIKYYVKELKLLSLYGSVAFDEDLEGELAENHDTQTEISMLATSPNPELSEAFINTELYARVSVAVLFYKLADLVDSVELKPGHRECFGPLVSGKLFLLELLDAAVNDKDLSKELYKKYSAIHRRKIRAWQMICVLSHFVCQDIVGKVTEYLHLSLCRNNLPAIRQYLETFAINTYLKFPSLVGEQLVPILRDYDMKPQALASYVFIAANVILHSSEAFQSKHLEELLPPVFPLLTSHHHSLRGFTQLLAYKVLSKFFPDSDATATVSLEKRCFEDMKKYLSVNSDCKRLRASMEGFLDAYDPILSVTPAGIFVNRVEELEFECVPKSLMEEVLIFLNDVREDLRSSMAKDLVAIKNESLKSSEDHVQIASKDIDGNSFISQPSDMSVDFQKKTTLHKHEKQNAETSLLSSQNESYKQLLEFEKEDQLLDHVLESRRQSMEKFRTSRQDFIMLASLVDRVPNLAGLARTCEVFKASALAVPDANIVHDKQFQLISVTADRWVPIIEVPVDNMKIYLEKKKREGYSILGLEQTANSVPLDRYSFPKKTVLVLGREKEGIPVDIIHILDGCVEIPQLGVVRSLNVHVSGAIALWEYTRQQRS